MKSGGIDWVAVTTARMKGWKTRTFTEKACIHHRKIGAGSYMTLLTYFGHGQKDYRLGSHLLWEIFKAFYQMSKKPYIFRGLFLLSGYTWAFLKNADRPVPAELVMFSKMEQMKRLKNTLRKIMKITSK